MRPRYQKGYVYKKGNLWLIRYYDYRVLSDGTIERIQRAHKLVDAVGEYRSKAAARKLAEEFLAPLNSGRATPQSTMTLTQFVEGQYLPFVESHKRISTYHGYRNMWKRYLRTRGEIALRDFRTVDGERILAEVTETNNLTSTTLAHVKAFLSGVFRFAKRRGVLNSENPMREVVLPKGNAAGDTYAYTLEEITQMLNVLPEPAATVVAAAAFTGARRGELRGFLWQNYDGEQIFVSQSYWRRHRAQEEKKPGSGPGHCAPCRTQQPAPETLRKSGRRSDVRQPFGQADEPGCSRTGFDSAGPRQGGSDLARLACFPAWTGFQPQPAWN